MTDITDIATSVVRREMGNLGLDRVVVSEGPDHNGEDSLFIEARMKPAAKIVGGEVSLKTHAALTRELLRAGERRFAYFSVRHPEKSYREPPRSKAAR